MSDRTLIFRTRPARRKARATATAEALSVLSGLGVQAMPGGPLSEMPGVFWLSCPEQALEAARCRLPRLGYAQAVDLVEARVVGSTGQRGAVRLSRIYQEDEEVLRESASDRRPFALKIGGEVRQVRGYRGDGGTLSRRGLPSYDARLLVNLARGPGTRRLLDPFAGAGGILVEARAGGLSVVSADNDPFVAHGLAAIADAHFVADARALPLGPETVGAIATEPPYEAAADSAVISALAEMRRVLEPGSRVSLLAAARQADALRREAGAIGLDTVHAAAIYRKGTACAVFVWEKSA